MKKITWQGMMFSLRSAWVKFPVVCISLMKWSNNKGKTGRTRRTLAKQNKLAAFQHSCPHFCTTKLVLFRRSCLDLKLCPEWQGAGYLSQKVWLYFILDLNIRCSNSSIRSWEDLGNTAYCTEYSWQVMVHYHHYCTGLQMREVLLLLGMNMETWEIMLNKMSPELISKDLLMIPVTTA